MLINKLSNILNICTTIINYQVNINATISITTVNKSTTIHRDYHVRFLRPFAVKSSHDACVQNASSCCNYSASCRTTAPTITEKIFVLRLFQQIFFRLLRLLRLLRLFGYDYCTPPGIQKFTEKCTQKFTLFR